MSEQIVKLVNINTGSVKELVAVKGIGEGIAKRIVENRPFIALDDLVKVSGINEIKLKALMPYLTLESKPKPASRSVKKANTTKITHDKPFTKLGETEAFIFLENRNERQDALLIVLGGFLLGLIILFLRRTRH